MKIRRLNRSLPVLALLALGCARAPEGAGPATPSPAAAPPPAASAPTAGAPALAEPPPPGIAPEAPFPPIAHRKLENGLELRVVERHNLPIVELRLVVLSGTATDGGKPGVAALAGELAKAGGAGRWGSRELVERAESLGASLQVLTDRDATTISIGVTTKNVDPALDLIAAVAEKPRFAPVEFTKLRQREIERVQSLARTDPGWAASMVLFRELYQVPTGSHPYSHYDTTPAELEQITLEDCRRWYKTHVTPENAVLVVAGDITPELAEKAARRVFGTWRGKAPERPTFTPPTLAERRSIFVVDRPESPQAQIYVASFGPERKSDAWAPLRAANQILGGGVAGRLFLDVREKRSLAYSTGSRLEEVAAGPVPVMLSAGTQTPRAGLAVKALLEHMAKLSDSSPEQEETAVATRYLADSFLIMMETIGAVASMTARLKVLGLADDYYDEYRKRVRSVEPSDVQRVGERYFDAPRALIVVAGDAKTIAPTLSHFGPVKIVDPNRGFVIDKTLPHDPSAPLEPAAAK